MREREREEKWGVLPMLVRLVAAFNGLQKKHQVLNWTVTLFPSVKWVCFRGSDRTQMTPVSAEVSLASS